MSAPQQEWVVQVDAHDAGERIDRLLARRLDFHSRTEFKGLLQQGRVSSYSSWHRDTEPILRLQPSHRVAAGELITVTLDAAFLRDQPEEEPRALAEDLVIFEDDHIVAVNKPSGCAVHPTKRYPENSLVELLHRRSNKLGHSSHPTPCHRLDRETSGVVVFARTKLARTSLGKLFEQEPDLASPTSGGGTLFKTYQAVVHGVPELSRGFIRFPIGPDLASQVPMRRRTFASSAATPDTRPCLTYWRLLKSDRKLRRSLLQFRPLSGRQHQLRVHAAAIGHAILGDCLYQSGPLGSHDLTPPEGSPLPEQARRASDALFLRSLANTLTDQDRLLLGSSRLALHATSLSFPHPMHQTHTMIQAPMPTELTALLKRGRLSNIDKQSRAVLS